jgi:hypothetical protein
VQHLGDRYKLTPVHKSVTAGIEHRRPENNASLRMTGAQVKQFALCSREILNPLMQDHTSLPSWRSWLVMHAIVQLIDHKSMGVKDVENLDKAIRAHAMLYKAAWPSRLRPKLHFLTHFPLEVLLCGLARHYWCFAFERKNMVITRAVEASNYKDASGSTMETLSFRQAFALKFANNNTMLFFSLLPMPHSAEQRSRRAAKERERRAATRDRRAAEAPPSRQTRLDSDKASTRRRRQAQTLEFSITAKRRNSRMRAELRRQAADIAAARCARRDATRGRFLSRFRLSFGWLQCATVRV